MKGNKIVLTVNGVEVNCEVDSGVNLSSPKTLTPIDTSQSKNWEIPKRMSFQEALKILGIEEYGERIFNAHRTGELFYLEDYITAAMACEEGDAEAFSKSFKETVDNFEKAGISPDWFFVNIRRIILGEI